MKTTKPNTMSLLFRTHLLNGKDIFTVSALATFSFNTKEPRLLEDQELWKLVKLNLDKDEIFDLGLPKSRGEFLIYGKACSTKPVQGIGIHASVGDLSKTLVVLGQRYWTSIGISKPENFTQIPVSYANAYGGKEFAENPIGKGYFTNSEGKTYLPNIENPNKPITRRSDQPLPAGFSAYPIDWPQRMQYMGQIDPNYVKETWPEFPKGTNPLIFNAAPQDQQLKGFFKGTEKFTIKNMHSANPTQNSQLPGIRVRIFVVQKENNDQEIFKELQAKPETLWLFPNQEVGALLFRASTTVCDEEYSDISQLYAVWEPMSEREHPIEFYANQLLGGNEIAEEPVAENIIDTPITEEDITEEPAIEETTPKKEPELAPPELNDVLKSLQDLQGKMAAQLKSMGADPAAEMKKFLNPTPQPETPLPDLNSALKEMEKISQDIIKKNNLTQSDLDKVLNQNNSNNNISLSTMIKKLQGSSSEIPPELKTNLSELEQLTQKLQAETPKDPNEESPIEEMTISPPQINQEPTLAPKDLTREDVINLYAINKNLSNLQLNNLDLSDLILTGADFSNSTLRNINFESSNLDGALFESSFIENPNFTNASLIETQIINSYVGNAIFLNSNFYTAKVMNSDLSKSTFINTNLQQAKFTEVNLDQSDMESADASKANFIRCIMSNCNFTKANLTEINLTDSDLSLSILNNAKLNSVTALRLKLAGCNGESTDFRNANLSYSRADETTNFTKSSFKDSDLTLASWEGAQLTECSFNKAIFDEANFSSTSFYKSNLELASAKKTNFSKANFENADLNRINLFSGSLRRSRLLATDLRYSNLYAVDFYKATMGQTDLTGANLDQTLLSAMGVNPKII